MQQNIHGGDIYSRPVRLDFSVNGNPLGMPAEARLSLLAAIDHVGEYPDAAAGELTETVSHMLSVQNGREIPKEYLLFGNGASELFLAIVHALKPKNIVTNFEAITMLVRCLGYDNIKTENETYPYKYLEIAEQLKLLENTTINKTVDKPIAYGNMFVLLLNAMRSNINDSTQKLWDFGLKTALYEKVTGKVTSVNDSGYIVENNAAIISVITDNIRINPSLLLGFFSEVIWFSSFEFSNVALTTLDESIKV